MGPTIELREKEREREREREREHRYDDRFPGDRKFVPRQRGDKRETSEDSFICSLKNIMKLYEQTILNMPVDFSRKEK